MTRFVVDAGVLIHLAEHGIEPAAGRELLAPTLIRSEVLSVSTRPCTVASWPTTSPAPASRPSGGSGSGCWGTRCCGAGRGSWRRASGGRRALSDKPEAGQGTLGRFVAVLHRGDHVRMASRGDAVGWRWHGRERLGEAVPASSW